MCATVACCGRFSGFVGLAACVGVCVAVSSAVCVAFFALCALFEGASERVMPAAAVRAGAVQPAICLARPASDVALVCVPLYMSRAVGAAGVNGDSAQTA